jgi:hypothetical protein
MDLPWIFHGIYSERIELKVAAARLFTRSTECLARFENEARLADDFESNFCLMAVSWQGVFVSN